MKDIFVTFCQQKKNNKTTSKGETSKWSYYIDCLKEKLEKNAMQIMTYKPSMYLLCIEIACDMGPCFWGYNI